ncbi:uncharacterized protein LOC126905905 [Daktulosphaira vitifoliae]|uniref:uncharacterized protein LOC126905905 n=1 Tax=Daktulosphaira vitifoliae TaxID=58002 RepID=UPI0021A9ADD6|nr:uncharacterized protein LOC126905905 [Daktulosphaira vitifoliae]
MFKNILLCIYFLASIITIKVYGKIKDEVLKEMLQQREVPLPPIEITDIVKSLKVMNYIVGDVIDDVINFFIVKSQKQDTILYISTYIYSSICGNNYLPLIDHIHNTITSKETLILVNVNVFSAHWILGVINLKKKKIIILDSKKSSIPLKQFEHLHFIMCAYLNVKTFNAKSKLKPIESKCKFIFDENAVQQRNPFDCGIFVCIHAFHYITDFPTFFKGTIWGRQWLFYCYTEYEKFKNTSAYKDFLPNHKSLNEDVIKNIIDKTKQEKIEVKSDQVIKKNIK